MIYFLADFGYFDSDSEYDNYQKLKKLSSNIISNFKKKNNDNDTTENNDILLLGGDNFYHNGLNEMNYESYSDNYLDCFGSISSSTYAILGNHDYLGNTHYQLTGYNRNSNIPNLSLFNMDNRYYKLQYQNFDIYMLDTCLINPHNGMKIYNIVGQYNDYITKYKEDNEFYNFKNANDFINIKRRELLTWLDTELHKSKMDFRNIIICGHYPLLTYGMYSDCNYNNPLFLYLIPLILKHDVKLYISGHDHVSQIQTLNIKNIKTIYNRQFIPNIFDKEIIDILVPNLTDLLNNSNNYYLYNIVSGACLDNYYSNKYYLKDYEIDCTMNYDNDKMLNLYLRLNIVSNDKIIVEFLHNNINEHSDNPETQFIEYRFLLNF